MTMASGARPVRAARGTELSCLGWQQEDWPLLNAMVNVLVPMAGQP